MSKYDIMKIAKTGATFLLNAPYEGQEVWNHLPKEVQQQIIDKKINFYSINAVDVARKTGMGQRINTIMQTCFFAISNILPKDEAIAQIKNAIKKTYSKKGDAIVQKNSLFKRTLKRLMLLWLTWLKSMFRLKLTLNCICCRRFRPMLLSSLRN